MAYFEVFSSGGSEITVDSELSTTSTNPVENRVVTGAINGASGKIGVLEDLATEDEYDNLVDAINEVINSKQGTLTIDDAPTQNSNNVAKSGGIYSFVNGQINEAIGLALLEAY